MDFSNVPTKRLLVFGATGQVATELARFSGITALGRRDADLSNPEACAELITQTDADAIINAAAYTGVDAAETDTKLAFRVNFESPSAMAEAAAKRAVPFLHISTDYVFDGSGSTPWRETDQTAPLGVYGASKLAGEQGVQAAGGAHAILRTSWVVSAHGNNFVKTMLRLGAEHEALNVVADQIGGPTPARDIATTLISMAHQLCEDEQKTGIYHYAGSPDTNWADFAREIFLQSQVACSVTDITSSQYPTPAVRPMNSRLNCSKLTGVFNIPRPDWRLKLSEILEDLKVN